MESVENVDNSRFSCNAPEKWVLWQFETDPLPLSSERGETIVDIQQAGGTSFSKVVPLKEPREGETTEMVQPGQANLILVMSARPLKIKK